MILDALRSQLIQAQKANDTLRVSVLRYFLSAIKNKEIELRPQKLELNDEVIFKVLRKQMKQRRESIEEYKKGNRQDLVDKETAELGVLGEIEKMFPPEIIQKEDARRQAGPRE